MQAIEHLDEALSTLTGKPSSLTINKIRLAVEEIQEARALLERVTDSQGAGPDGTFVGTVGK